MINVSVEDISVENSIVVTLIDDSGCHVVLTLSIRGQPPLSHAFSFYEGYFNARMPRLNPGVYDCSFTVQAYDYYGMNKMYDSKLQINGKTICHVKGNIPKDKPSDSGTDSFQLIITQ
jgi:hypothetical protein